LQLLRQHHDPQRQLLQMHELRKHQRVQLKSSLRGGRIWALARR